MRLTWLERLWLRQLMMLHRHPPTWQRFLLRAPIAALLTFAFTMGGAISAFGLRSAETAFVLGATICFVYVLLCVGVKRVLGQRLMEEIIDWSRVEALDHASDSV